MTFRIIVTAFAIFAPLMSVGAQDLVGRKLPKEVTPELRAACEKDVRKLCIRKGSTFASVKSCVMANFAKLNTGCKIRLIRAGL